MEVWGLKFGVYVARHGTQDGGQISLATATRRFADAFLVSELAKREQRLGEGQSDQHAFLTAQAKQEYLHYLLREEARMREQETPRYQEFMQGRDKRRTTLLRLAGGDAQSPLLRSFDSDSGRLTDFQTFFSDQVPGLEAWRAHTKEGRQRTTTP